MFKAIDLPYAKEDLSPAIDPETMDVHYEKHYKGYTQKLNDAIDGHEDLADLSIEDLLADIGALPEDVQKAVRNNGGGYYNHTLFFEQLSSESISQPEGEFATEIEDAFGSMEDMQEEFNAAAASVFGSGWAWLVVDDGQLKVVTTPNQDNPISDGMTPILGLDVWEHAYYLNYQNRRAEYIEAFWSIINWEVVTARYEAVMGE